MFSTQTISIQTRSVCIHNRNTTFFNHLPTRQRSTTICWIIIIGHWIRIACREMSDYGGKYLGFFSSRSLKTREKYISFAQFVYFLREVCLLYNFWIMKLKSKHSSLKKYTNWAKLIYFSLILREQEEKNPKYFAPSSSVMVIGWTSSWKYNIQFIWGTLRARSAIIEFKGTYK